MAKMYSVSRRSENVSWLSTNVTCVEAYQSFIFLHVIGRELWGAVVVVPAGTGSCVSLGTERVKRRCSWLLSQVCFFSVGCGSQLPVFLQH